MNKYISILLMIILTLAGLSITSCSDDEPAKIDTVTPTNADELGYLQNNLAVLDEEGDIKERVYGRVLDESTPETVYVGVENYDEAKDIFVTLFSDDTEISDDSSHARFTTRQGNAELTKENGDEGLVAKATFDIDGLKYVQCIRFILNSAWPENYDQNIYHVLGELYQYNAWEGKKSYYKNEKKELSKGDGLSQTFICIRECKNGVPALLVGLSNRPHVKRPPFSLYMISKKQFNEIYDIIGKSWNFYKAAFNSDGTTRLTEDKYFWVETKGWYDYVGNLHTGSMKKINYWEEATLILYRQANN